MGGTFPIPPTRFYNCGRESLAPSQQIGSACEEFDSVWEGSAASWNETINWINRAGASGKLLPVIPEYALDMHTAEGQAKGRGRRHFFEEASRTHPEVMDRDRTYLERILKMLDSGELKD
jgi:hypothetical protein